MAVVSLPIRSDPAPSATAPNFMNEDDDPFQFQFDHYDEDPGPSLFAGGRTHKELTLKESTMKLQSPQLLIEKTLDVQMRTGSGLSSDVIAGDVLACTVGGEDVQSTPSRGRRRSVPSGGEDPTPKRRRLRGKSAPPPASASCSHTPQSSTTSASLCSLTDTPESASSIDDSKADNDEELEKSEGPVDEWRTQFLMAYNTMRRYYYNSPEHHDLKALKQVKGAQDKKVALYHQWSTKKPREKWSLQSSQSNPTS